MNFFTRQYIDALSPSNFALTNPEVFRETVKSHGQNLLKGFNNLLRDIEEGDGQLRVKMTDPSAFELGRNVAVTPGNAFGANAVILLQRGFQQPEQALVFCDDETALADQRLGKGAQVFFLDELAVDHVRLGQLCAQLLQVKSVGQ